ncbi:hypothetical protein HDV62DRAFT_370078 [Trichoderma sp. SZMC 28011]
MVKSIFFLLIYAAIVVIVRADGLSDFSNNLASDLGPLLSLFGDAVTRQYLSESTRFIDYFIFAMAPIGIISTITAVIRVCGGSSLRAFIGRAQEGQGTTEAELCTSTSADVCELFTKGGITRVLGRPDIVELIYISDGDQANKNEPKSASRLHLFTSYLVERSNGSCWPRMEFSGLGNTLFNRIGNSSYTKSVELAPKPNLSLNVGIRRQPDWAFYVVAIIGFVLQAGILVFAGSAVWLLKWNLQKSNTKTPQDYAPGVFITGTIILCLGIWLCAALIGQTTNERYYRRLPESSDILYWVQPGPQIIGDQTFRSFAYSDAKPKDRLNMWVSSTKDFNTNFEVITFIAVSLVLVGYIAQFIGLRGMNAWISIAQLGITLVMSVLRGILRIKRLDKSHNHLDMWHDLVAGHELDWLAFDMAEQELQKLQNESGKKAPREFNRKSPSQASDNKLLWYITGQHEKAIRLDHSKSSDHIDDASKANTLGRHVAASHNLLRNRIRLSNLTGHFDEVMDTKHYLPWKDERVRVRAKAKCLGTAISQAAATLLRNQANKKNIHLRVKAAFSYGDSSCEETVVSVKMEPPTGPDRINWNVDSSQLEAILGLWLWSTVREEYKKVNSSDRRGGAYGMSSSIKKSSTRIFRIINASHEKWDESIDAYMSLWLGSGNLNYHKQSLSTNLVKGYRYSLADDWIVSDEEKPISTRNAEKMSQGNSNVDWLVRVKENSSGSVSGLQKFCGWSQIYDAFDIATAKRFSKYIPVTGKFNVKGFFVKDNEHSLLEICAQELFIALLRSMNALEFRNTDDISVSESGGNIRLENSIISSLAKSFTDNQLGTHSEAISCLIPLLRSQTPFYNEKVFSALIRAATKYRQDEEWNSAEVVLRWACEYYNQLYPASTQDPKYFTAALRELGELYRRSLSRVQHLARQEFGANGIKWMAAEYGKDNLVVNLYTTVAEKINLERNRSEEWKDKLHNAILTCSRPAALFYLCFAKGFNRITLSKYLTLAARNGWDEIASVLLEMKAEPNSRDDRGRTAASYFAESGQQQSLQRLVDMDADLDLADFDDMTPLAYAASNGHEDIVRLLLETDRVELKPSYSGEKNALWLAVDQNHMDIIEQFIDKGVDVRLRNHKDHGLLDLAIRRGHHSLVTLLLKRDLKIEQNRPIHPLIWAAWRGFTEIMQLFVKDNAIHKDVVAETRALLKEGIVQPLRNHSDGWVSTLDNGFFPTEAATGGRSKCVEFDPPYKSRPYVMIGISGFNVGGGSDFDVRWGADKISQKDFTLLHRSNESKGDFADAVWIEFSAGEKDFQGNDIKRGKNRSRSYPQPKKSLINEH